MSPGRKILARRAVAVATPSFPLGSRPPGASENNNKNSNLAAAKEVLWRAVVWTSPCLAPDPDHGVLNTRTKATSGEDEFDQRARNKRRYSRTFALDGVPAAVLDDQPKANSPPHCASSRGTSW